MLENLSSFAAGNFNLTIDQLEAVKCLDSFIHGNERCFVLKGYAGTGKTYLTRCIALYLSKIGKRLNLMAPTGRAARILQEKSGFEATTIHKGIYDFQELEEIITQNGGKEKYKFRYNLKKIENDIATIFLVDEASMISDKYTEDDFFVFGSGYLLKDLLSLIVPNNNDRKSKLIFIGDNAQLPPVGDNKSGALSTPFLNEKYGIETKEYELTEVIRQDKASGILSNSIYLRNQLANKKRNEFQLQTNNQDVKLLPNNEAVSNYLQLNPHLEADKAVIINYSNKSALDYNLEVRKKLFPNSTSPLPGELLIINQNNYNFSVELMNGTLVRIKEIDPMPIIKSGMKSYNQNGEDCEITHIFRKLIIEAPFEGRTVDVSCMILENFLSSDQRTLDYAENIALYIDFKIRHPHLKPRTTEFKEALRADPYFNVLRVKYGYAITCHKAQGGEWQHVLVNMDVSQGKLSDLFLRWTYTAITRSKEHLYLFNLPNVGQFSSLEYHHRTLNTTIENTPPLIQFHPPEDLHEQMQRLGLIEAPHFLQNKFLELLARLVGTGITITTRKSNNYHEAYTLARNGKQATFLFHYNGRNQFTRTQVTGSQNDPQLEQEALSILTKAFNYRIVLPEDKEMSIIKEKDESASVIYFPEEKRELEPLYTELSAILKLFDATVESIIHHNYQEIYTIVRREEKVVIKFYFDGRNRFTSGDPDLINSNSNVLLWDIEKAIQILKTL